MPGIKKRAGKTTFTIYAAEARQFRGVIDILNFIELNHDKDDFLSGNAGTLASGLAAILDRLEKPKKEQTDEVERQSGEGDSGRTSGAESSASGSEGEGAATESHRRTRGGAAKG